MISESKHIIMQIVTYPNKILRKKSQLIENFSNLKKFIPEFIKTLQKNKGLGLSAPQVGKSWQIIAIDTKEGPQIFINPSIIKQSKETNIAEEGCLSLPKQFFNIKRSTKITVQYQDQNKNKNELTAKGLYARVLQHEIDHLNGILIIDKSIKNDKK